MQISKMTISAVQRDNKVCRLFVTHGDKTINHTVRRVHVSRLLQPETDTNTSKSTLLEITNNYLSNASQLDPKYWYNKIYLIKIQVICDWKIEKYSYMQLKCSIICEKITVLMLCQRHLCRQTGLCWSQRLCSVLK